MITTEGMIAIRSNFLIVDGTELHANVLKGSGSERRSVSPTELYQILTLGRSAILNGIESVYEQTQARNPDLTVVRPSIWTATLGTTVQSDEPASEVFTQKGHNNGGIITQADELQDSLHDHWSAILDAGFVPEVRRTSGAKNDAGSWLLLRKPTLRDVMVHWFKPYAPTDDTLVRAVESVRQHKESLSQRKELAAIRAMGERAVDTAYDQPEHRTNAQIAQLLAMAAIKEAIGNTGGSQEETDDAVMYAHNNPFTPDSAVRAIENSQF